MAGHSKWANIKHRKGKQDAVKGKIFTKLIREITVAAKYGADPGANSRLRLAIDRALVQNMPRDTIDRAIKRGAGGGEEQQVDEVTYEGYAQGGVAVLVECLTDNRNRTAGEVRHVFSKHGGNLGTVGSVAYLFKQQGCIGFSPSNDEEQIMAIALEVGAEDVITNQDGSIEVVTVPEQFLAMRTAFEGQGLEMEIAELSQVAATQISLDQEMSVKLLNLVEALEQLDDVQEVYTNGELNLPEE